MNRWKTRALAGLAVLALGVAGCQDQGTDDLDTLDASPSIDLPRESDSTDDSMESSPSMEASPSDS
jgi:hypothetical protein